MKSIKRILSEKRLNLNNTQKGIIASMAISATPKLAYSVVTGARNSVAERRALASAGIIVVNDDTETAELTNAGQEVLTTENLIDEDGQLTDRGKELVDRYRGDQSEWQRFESFKYFV